MFHNPNCEHGETVHRIRQVPSGTESYPIKKPTTSRELDRFDKLEGKQSGEQLGSGDRNFHKLCLCAHYNSSLLDPGNHHHHCRCRLFHHHKWVELRGLFPK
eukprot:Lithocolla_globosa_v1_NODE_103_length_6349_cov_4.180489.p6 type:complete len:102 gc:universal NODE_103_length_6349_cov_4.180489:6083-5778(-)